MSSCSHANTPPSVEEEEGTVGQWKKQRVSEGQEGRDA